MVGFTSENSHANGENRRERGQFLKALQAEFKEAKPNQRDTAFTLVANMLTNMQDANPKNMITGSQLKSTKQASKVQKRQNAGPTKVISCIFKVNDDLR